MFYLIAFVVAIIDQLTKYLVRTYMTEGQSIVVWTHVLAITYYRNAGAAFGMLQNRSWLFVLIALLVAVVVVYMERRVPRNRVLLRGALAILLGGAVGNLIDRLVFHQVTDFIETLFIHYPIFNLADCAITIAVVLIIIDSLRNRNGV